jgi:hypothetical protein
MNPIARRAPEDGILAGELAQAFGRMLDQYAKHFALSREDAAARAAQLQAADSEGGLARPPDQITWFDLYVLSKADPEKGKACWEAMKRAALDELQTGHRAAYTVETIDDNAWQRAQFLALREDLAAEWQPRNGIERQLLDTMAQAQEGWLFWMHRLTTYTSLEGFRDDRLSRQEARWQPPRQRDADALQQAAEMVDRFNRIFVRTLRALGELRRQRPKVIVKKGGQLNVAEKQVNVAVPTPGDG